MATQGAPSNGLPIRGGGGAHELVTIVGTSDSDLAAVNAKLAAGAVVVGMSSVPGNGDVPHETIWILVLEKSTTQRQTIHRIDGPNAPAGVASLNAALQAGRHVVWLGSQGWESNYSRRAHWLVVLQ